MKKLLLVLSMILFISSGFTSGANENSAATVASVACYNFAEERVLTVNNELSERGDLYGLSHEEEYNIWLEAYEYCTDPGTWWNQYRITMF